MKFSRVALLSAATLAVAQPHNHMHKHAARHGSPLEARDAATTTTVPGPTVTVYELNGDFIPWDDVEAGIKSGKYILVGDKITSVLTPTTSSTTPTPTPTTSTTQAAQFLEKKPSTSTTPTSTYVAPTTSSTSAAPTAEVSSAAVESASEAASDSSSSSGATGVDAEFPSGEIDCDDFDSLTKYGAVSAEYLGLNGYSGVQITPSYSIGAAAISYIETAISGTGCVKGSFCSYVCPAGYQKSQWPDAQGNTGQSIGGLYCNLKGKLELSRSSSTTLCEAGVGGAKAKNTLGKVVSVCRTDYPGTESETIFTEVGAGQTVALTNPDSATYYKWQGMSTTAQYYINPSGYAKEKACIWGTAGSNLGNWAPVNMGLGRSTSGETFMSLFPNKPTNPDGVLDFNIKITGDVSGKCSYEDGQYYNNGVESPTGCTVGVTGEAVVEFY